MGLIGSSSPLAHMSGLVDANILGPIRNPGSIIAPAETSTHMGIGHPGGKIDRADSPSLAAVGPVFPQTVVKMALRLADSEDTGGDTHVRREGPRCSKLTCIAPKKA